MADRSTAADQAAAAAAAAKASTTATAAAPATPSPPPLNKLAVWHFMPGPWGRVTSDRGLCQHADYVGADDTPASITLLPEGDSA